MPRFDDCMLHGSVPEFFGNAWLVMDRLYGMNEERIGMTKAVRNLNQKSQINIGIIGCGVVVETYHLPVLASIPDVKIGWVCDASVARARSVAKNWGVKQAIEKIEDGSEVDAVFVATPVGTRREILEKTTAKGWHAFCEKPFATSTNEHRDILENANRNGVRLGAGYVRRFLWAAERAQEMLRSKMLGPLKEIVGNEYIHLERTGVDMSSYRNNVKASGGGVLMETGCHLVDEVFFIADAKEVTVRACTQKTWNDYEVETTADARLTLASGEQVPLRLEVSGIRPLFSGVSLRCESGEIRIHLNTAKGMEVFFGKGQASRITVPSPFPGELGVTSAFRREWIYFLEALRTAGDWDMNWETGLMTTDFVMRCGELAKSSCVEVHG